MTKTTEQFAAANQAAVDSLLSIATTSLSNAERLAALNLNTARAFLADAAANVGALSAAKNPQDFFTLPGTLAKPAAEKTLAYSRSVYEILSESSTGLSRIVDDQTAELKKTLSAAIEQSLSQAPAGSEPMVAAVKSALAQAESAYETMTKSSQQAKAMFESTMASASAAAVKMMAGAA